MGTVTLEIPFDLVDTVIGALYRSADVYRADKANDAESIAVLVADADRLEAMAEKLEDDACRAKGVKSCAGPLQNGWPCNGTQGSCPTHDRAKEGR